MKTAKIMETYTEKWNQIEQYDDVLQKLHWWSFCTTLFLSSYYKLEVVFQKARAELVVPENQSFRSGMAKLFHKGP